MVRSRKLPGGGFDRGDLSDENIIKRDRERNLARDKQRGETRDRDTNLRTPSGTTTEKVGGEIVETRIVSKEEAFRVAAEAGGVPPTQPGATGRREIPGGFETGRLINFGEGAGGFQNVLDVLRSALNPFSKDRIIANTDNRIFNTAAEYIANAPYLSAAILTGAAGLGKGLIGRAGAKGATRFEPFDVRHFGRREAERALLKSGGIMTNTATAKATAGILARTAAQMKKPVFVLSAIGAMIGTYPWAEWALGEAKEGMIFNTGKAMATGDPEVIAEFQRVANEIFDITLWENIQRLIPGVNIAFSFGQKAKALMAQRAVNDRILQDEVIQIQTGETDDDKWKRIREEEAAQDKAAVDYYNTERKKMVQWEIEAKAAAQTARQFTTTGETFDRAAAIKARNEDAAFWAAQAARQRELEAEDRKAIADFWIEYRKTAQKIADNSRPSNLNFGLL